MCGIAPEEDWQQMRIVADPPLHLGPAGLALLPRTPRSAAANMEESATKATEMREMAATMDDRPYMAFLLLGFPLFKMTRATYENLPVFWQGVADDCLTVERKRD